MCLFRFPWSLLLHFFFIVSIILHVLSLYNGDFDHETPVSHVLQIASYLAGWILIFFPVKYKQFIFPFAVLVPWVEHIRLLFQYFLDPSTLAFWICLLVAVLLPFLAAALFKR